MYKEKFASEYGDLIELNAVLEGNSESMFKTFYNTLEKRANDYEWKEIFLMLPVKPVSKERPRLTGGIVYDPGEATKKYYVRLVQYMLFEELQKLELNDSVDNIDIDSALKDSLIELGEEMHIKVDYYQVPKSMSKIDTLLAVTDNIKHTKKPDIDNYDKFIYDVLQLTGLFSEDSAITTEVNTKHYSLVPRIEITIKYMTKKNGD